MPKTRVCLALVSASALALAGIAGTAVADTGDTHAAVPPTQNPDLMGVRYQQASAEVEALQLQAYNVATRRLDTLLAAHHGPKKPAIVVDLDETVLNNAAYQAAAIEDGFSYPAHWNQWVDAAEAPLIPGAGPFLHHADSKGVAIFYVSNRKTAQEAATIENLRRDGLPQVSKESVRLAGPPKAVRRDQIAAHYDILLLFGDSMHDFDAAYAGTPLLAQHEAVKRQAARFGSRYIVLPNATYGSWTHAPLSAWQPPSGNGDTGDAGANAKAGSDSDSANAGKADSKGNTAAGTSPNTASSAGSSGSKTPKNSGSTANSGSAANDMSGASSKPQKGNNGQ